MSEEIVILEKSIPATDQRAHALCLELRECLRDMLGPQGVKDRLFAIELVAREAIQNAVDYGCQRDPSKFVRFSARIIAGPTLRLTISDDGPGFNAEEVCQRELVQGEPESFGNGIKIISAYTNRYKYSNGGRTLEADFILGEGNLMQEKPNSGVWVPTVNLVAANISAAKEEVRKLVAGSTGEFVVDLSSVNMVDSKGLGLLIATYNSLEPEGRSMRVIGANNDLVDLFKMMRFDRHMKIG